jgi:hypothetical protein
MKKKKLCAYLLFGSIIAVGLAAKARGESKHGPIHDK